jgi:signal transduction histidine kinase
MTLRARLATLGFLALIALLAAAASVLLIARSTDQQRVDRAQESLAETLDLLRERVADDKPPHAGRMGFAGAFAPDGSPRWGGRPIPPSLAPGLRALRLRALQQEGTVYDQFELAASDLPPSPRGPMRAREGVMVLGARALPDRGVLWAARLVPMAPGFRRGRYAVLALVGLAVLLVAAAMRTVAQVQRDTAALQRSLRALGTDLSAPVESPQLGELATVADGLRDLARARAHAESERVRLEGALASRERLAALGRVVAGVAHEVRNPLASMKLKVDLARMQTGAEAELDTDLRELGEEISRLDRLITDLLVVAGRRSGPVTPCDLGALAAKRAALLDAWAEQQEVQIRASGEARARVDADGVSRVLDNLLRNAVQASPPGAEVIVRTRTTDGGAVVEVEDRGAGVPSDRVSELFEPFFTTRAEGTGLGLAMSRAVAEAHGGTLRYARDGAVTRFTLTIPA